MILTDRLKDNEKETTSLTFFGGLCTESCLNTMVAFLATGHSWLRFPLSVVSPHFCKHIYAHFRTFFHIFSSTVQQLRMLHLACAHISLHNALCNVPCADNHFWLHIFASTFLHIFFHIFSHFCTFFHIFASTV